MTLPLAGFRIIEASTVLAAPLSASLLAELGAEVIKVEEPNRGDPTRSFPPMVAGEAASFHITNRNKKSVELDLRTARGVDLLLALCRDADALVLNYRQSALDRWGLTAERLRSTNESLIVLHLTAFGRTGPYSDQPGFGRIAEAFAGLTYITGEADEPPYFPGYPIADGIGGIYGAFLLTVGLLHRARTGEGQLIDLALYEPLLRMMEDFVVRYDVAGEVKTRMGNDQEHSCPNGLFPTADGDVIVLPASTPSMWQRLLPFLDDDDGLLAQLDTPAKRAQLRSTVDGAVAAFTAVHGRDDLIDLLRAAGVACGVVNSVADICADPQVHARGNLVKVYDERLDRELLVQAPVGSFSSFETTVKTGPRLGEHTDRVLRELLGLDPDEIRDLRDQGVIGMG
ncbi:MAG: CaiB/BaiF CoA-transferase family protein [Xanthomonadales bacterium]|nr:CaiB/BaiF CoA-transferase family protein [Xanthomonadales bacterium]